jgi:hypothetical protein
MKPTLVDLEQYERYLIKNKLFDVVKEHVGHADFDKIVFKGDYQYDDEASYYFHLSSVQIFKDKIELTKFGRDDWKFFDKCFDVSKLLSEWQESYDLLAEDLKEPFILEKR